MKCKQCSFDNPVGFAFCGKCGSALESESTGFSQNEFERLRPYLSPALVSVLQLDLATPPQDVLEQCVERLTSLLDTVNTHLPIFLREQIQKSYPGHVHGQFVEGTLLFADISGFTAMSEQLSRMGREGAEEITAVVNRYFTAMLTILKQHQGQLVKFGGDALLGLFSEPESASRAAQAAQKMQAGMEAFANTKTSQGVFALKMKVSLHKGRFFVAQLGTAQNMEYALFGQDVNATAVAESAATPGQIILDNETWQAISIPHHATPLENPHYLNLEWIDEAFSDTRSTSPAPLPLAKGNKETVLALLANLEAAAPYLPVGLLSRLVADPHALSLRGEHRLVAVLFANVQGLGEIADLLGPGQEETIIQALNRYFVAMGQAIYQFGGVINKIDLYDKGDKLLAFFGAPIAHEDDAERAVRAAIAMQKTLEILNELLATETGIPDFRLQQQIGISLGYVFAGYVGTDWRHEYTVMGDEVNLAARMMSIAKQGTIIVSNDVRHKVQALFDFVSHGEVGLKGKRQPVPIFSVAGLRAIPESLRGVAGMHSQLVGRDAEWQQINAALEQLNSGRGQIVSLIGEAGLGKSRLMREVEQSNRSEIWVKGHCLSYTETVSYRPFRDLIRNLIGIETDDSEAEAWNKLRMLLEDNLPPNEVQTTLPFLASFLGLKLSDLLQEQVRQMGAEALQRRTFLAITILLQGYIQTQKRPLIIILEDIHWIDQTSLALIEYLLPLVDRVPLMFLMVYRPERTKTYWQLHEKCVREFAHCHTAVFLEPLSLASSKELLVNLSGLNTWPTGIEEILLSRSEGNPLYLEEVLHTLIDDGVLAQQSDGSWYLSREFELTKIPDTLQGVMMARLDRLAEPTRWTAQLASVVGREFLFDVLAYLRMEDVSQINQHLISLQQFEIVRERQRLPELEYRFRHGMMQQVCYSNLLSKTRQLYHRRIAEYLEDHKLTEQQGTEENYIFVAHHAYAGRDWTRALRYQLLAGDQAQDLFANHEAIDHFEKALSSARELPSEETAKQRLYIHTALGKLRTITGKYDEAQTHLTRAIDLAQEQKNRKTLAYAYRWLARVHENLGEYPTALELIERGLHICNDNEAEISELCLIAGLIHTRQGDYDDALLQCKKALQIATTLNDLRALARGHNLLGHIARLNGRSVDAIESFRKSFEIYEQVGDLSGEALASNQIANAYFDMSQWQEANHHYLVARQIFEQIGDVYNRALADNNLAGIALNQGRLDEAIAFYHEGLHTIEQINGSLWALGGFHSNLGAAYVRAQKIEQARNHLQISQSYFSQAKARDWLSELHRHLAEAALIMGELTEATKECETALQIAQELGMQNEEAKTLRVLGEIYTKQNQYQRAETALEKSLDILADSNDKYAWARSQLSLAHLYASYPKPELALESLRQCMPIFEKLQAKLDIEQSQKIQYQLKTSI